MLVSHLEGTYKTLSGLQREYSYSASYIRQVTRVTWDATIRLMTGESRGALTGWLDVPERTDPRPAVCAAIDKAIEDFIGIVQ